MDRPALANTVLGAGVGTALVQLIAPMIKERAQKKSHAAYMAMRLASILESYTAEISHFISSNKNAYAPPDEEFPAWETELPSPGQYPDDGEGWKALDPHLADRCFVLRNKIASSQGVIRSTIEYDMDSLEEELNEQAAARGIEAWEIAKSLRQKYRLQEPEMVYDFVASLLSVRDDAIEKKRKGHSLRARLIATIKERQAAVDSTNANKPKAGNDK